MKRPPDRSRFMPAPADSVLLFCWRSGMDTDQIARRFTYPEYNVASRLWRLREELKQPEGS